MLLKHQWVIEEIQEESKKYLETNQNGNIMIQNLCNTTKAVLRGKFLLQETNKNSNNLTLHQKELEKQEQTKSKDSRRQEIIKI